jgi:hypothetical protein
VTRISHLDLPGSGQVVVDRGYAYIGHMEPPYGTSIVDIANPNLPAEVGHYIPEPVGGNPSPQSNDVDVDDNGLIYLMDRVNGFDILEYNA